MKNTVIIAKSAENTKPTKNFPAKAMRLISVNPVLLCRRKTSGANDNKSLAKSPLAIIKGTNFLAEKPNGR